MRVAVVLVSPRNPGNVGLVARTMANFALARLVIVDPSPLPVEKDFLAARAEGRPFLEGAVRHGSLAAALADEQVAVAVTRRTGRHRPGDLVPAALADLRVELATDTRVAFVFGRESDGLTQEEAGLCNRRLRIPTSDEAPSLNLAQAVAVVASRLFEAEERERAAQSKTGESTPGRLGDLEEFFAAFEPMLEEIGFFEGGRDAHMMGQLRRFFGRAHPTEREIRLLRGLVTKIRAVRSSGR